MNDLQKKQKEVYITKAFWLSFQVIFIFGIPAIIGSIVGTYLDSFWKTGYTITVVILGLTFILSWLLVIVKYRKLSQELKNFNKSIINEGKGVNNEK